MIVLRFYRKSARLFTSYCARKMRLIVPVIGRVVPARLPTVKQGTVRAKLSLHADRGLQGSAPIRQLTFKFRCDAPSGESCTGTADSRVL